MDQISGDNGNNEDDRNSDDVYDSDLPYTGGLGASKVGQHDHLKIYC